MYITFRKISVNHFQDYLTSRVNKSTEHHKVHKKRQGTAGDELPVPLEWRRSLILKITSRKSFDYPIWEQQSPLAEGGARLPQRH